MHLKFVSILETFSILWKKYFEFRHSQENNIYRIIEIKSLNANEYKITIQIIGKSSIIECSPKDILGSDHLLEGFSRKDIRTLTCLAYEQNVQPTRYKIIMQEFCEKMDRMLFKLKRGTDDKLIVKMANQIVMDKKLINCLSKEDINTISYIAGYECSQNEKFSN